MNSGYLTRVLTKSSTLTLYIILCLLIDETPTLILTHYSYHMIFSYKQAMERIINDTVSDGL